MSKNKIMKLPSNIWTFYKKTSGVSPSPKVDGENCQNIISFTSIFILRSIDQAPNNIAACGCIKCNLTY